MSSKLNPLKLTRMEKGLSQWEIAKETGIHQSTISLYERGYKDPKPEHKEILAKALGKEVRELWKSP
jgi:transcriptional regulator with XRE-family HTH domain